MKKIIWILIAMTFLTSSLAYAEDWREGYCENGVCSGSYFNDKYIGQWSNHRPHGKGKMKFLNGDEYVGEFKDGRPHGKGALKCDNKEYIGEFKMGVFDGHGSYKGSIFYYPKFNLRVVY